MVLPVWGGTGEPWEAAKRDACETREAARVGHARPPGPDQRPRRPILVKPDRHLGPKPADEASSDPRLRFGERVGPGVLGRARTPDRPPSGGEVAVQVDAAPVLPGAGRIPV